MRKTKVYILFLIAASLILVTCNKKETALSVESITLNSTTATLNLRNFIQLTATITPADVENPDVVWSSSNVQVALVNTTGGVTAVGAGTATITVTTADGGKTASCVITVPEVHLTDVMILAEGTLKVRQTLQLKAIFLPDGVTNKNVTWSSGNTAIATIDEKGLVTGVDTGSVIITVTTIEGGKTATQEIPCVFGPAITLGEKNESTATDWITDGGDSYPNMSNFTATQTFTAEEIRAKIKNNANGFKAAIYSDNAGVPNQLLGETDEVTNAIDGWNTFKLKARVNLTAGNVYWFALTSNDPGQAVVYISSTSGKIYWCLANYATWPPLISATTGQGSSNSSHLLIYAWGH